jgi:hypothetical protein
MNFTRKSPVKRSNITPIFAAILAVTFGCQPSTHRKLNQREDSNFNHEPSVGDSIEKMMMNRVEYLSRVLENDTVKWIRDQNRDSWNNSSNERESGCGFARLYNIFVNFYRNKQSGLAYEIRYYKSGRSISIASADLDLKLVDSGCESLFVEYHFIPRKYTCRLYTEDPRFEPVIDMIPYQQISIQEADSVLATWGLTRQWPIEEWEEEYINGQK